LRPRRIASSTGRALRRSISRVDRAFFGQVDVQRVDLTAVEFDRLDIEGGIDEETLFGLNAQLVLARIGRTNFKGGLSVALVF
jgi:hypothetical protein